MIVSVSHVCSASNHCLGTNTCTVKVNVCTLSEHKIRVFGRTKTGQAGHLSEQMHVWPVGDAAVQLSELNH